MPQTPDAGLGDDATDLQHRPKGFKRQFNTLASAHPRTAFTEVAMVKGSRSLTFRARLVIEGLSAIVIEAGQCLAAAMRIVDYGARNYPRRMGLFVETVEGMSPPPGHCWTVWVNGERLKEYGISDYIVQPGDRIQLKIEPVDEVARGAITVWPR
jgi:hypothetical protein